jgi:trehalose 6-phosphate phosphatase
MTLEDAIEALVGRGEVLIGLDFDGTLAPIAPRPDLAVADPRALRLVEDLARRPRLRVAIVSGRALADLRRHIGELPEVVLIGEHGNDTGHVARPQASLMAAVEFARSLGARFPHATIEEKPSSVALHTRALETDATDRLTGEVRSWVATRDHISLLEGKEVLELTTGLRTKGDAIAELADGCDGIIFVGDDVSDETVFARLGPDDVGIKVGPGDSKAAYRVDGPEGVLGVLELIHLASS